MNKRIVAFISAAALLIGGIGIEAPSSAEIPQVSEAVSEPSETVQAAEATETPLSARLTGELQNGGLRYKITLTAQNSASEEQGGVLVVARYDAKTNMLLSKELTSVSVAANSEETKTVYADIAGESEYVKAFFWDSVSGMLPLAESINSKIDSSAEIEAIPLSTENVWATDRQDGHGIEYLFDGSKDSYMAGEAKEDAPVVITAELGDEYDLAGITVGFHSSGNKRSYSFDVTASLDGKTYFTVLEKQTSNSASDLPVDYEIDGRAKFVRLNVYGYNGNDAGWIRVNALSLHGARSSENLETALGESFADATSEISDEPSEDEWFAYALDEETYTDYTPALGSGLYAAFAALPEEAGLGNANTALCVFDDVSRTDDGSGAGSVGAFRKLPIPENGEDYTLGFKLYIPETAENISWAGISLLGNYVTGGADLTPTVALQLRFSEEDGKAVINTLDSVQFNEGKLRRVFENGFELGSTWDVTLKVSPSGARTEITISDGTTTETRVLGFNYTDVERVNNQTWKNTSVNYLAINSGAGGKLAMYVDDVYLSYYRSESSAEQDVIYSQDFESISTPDEADIVQAVVKKNDDGTTGGSSLGSDLKAEVAASGTFGGHVLKLTDTNGGDGLVVGVPLTVPDNDNKYIIKWKMRDFKLSNYSGISLASGFNEGKTDYDHPMALQMRYSLQSDGIQINKYSSIAFNDGSFGAFTATGGNRLSTSAALEFEIEVNPVTAFLTVTITDGSRTVTASQAFETTTSDEAYTETWADKKPDYLLFHTSASGKSDCIIDNISVIDTGVTEAASNEAVGGIVRLESQWGTGKFLTERDGDDIGNLQGIDPDLTRFVERPGLADADGVSFESNSNPGMYLFAEESDDVNHGYRLVLKELDMTAQTKAQATFYKQIASNTGSYSGTSVNYVPMWDLSRKICYTNTADDPVSVLELSDSDYTHSALFYLRSEATNYVSDNFKGTELNSQWYNNYPWKSADSTNSSYNFSALIDYRNIEVSDGRLLLKATKVSGWPKNVDGDTGIDYSGKYNYYNGNAKGYVRWQGRVGVISSKRVFYRQSLVSGRFKQPESPLGYWNAFWLNAQSGWPPETDIFEYMSHKGTDTWYTATHRKNSSGSEVGYGGWQTVSGVNVRTGYHDFTLDWGYSYMRFYVDGKLYRTITGDDVDEQNKGVQMILNTGVGGWELEPSDADAVEKYGEMVWDTGMECEWVRTFRY